MSLSIWMVFYLDGPCGGFWLSWAIYKAIHSVVFMSNEDSELKRRNFAVLQRLVRQLVLTEIHTLCSIFIIFIYF